MTGQTVDNGADVAARGAATVAPRAKARPIADVLPLVLLFYAFFLPGEIRVEISGLAIYPHRMAFLVLLPWCLTRSFDRLHAVDVLVFVAASWMVLSFSVFYGFEQGVVRGAALAIDAVAAYLIARLSIRSLRDLRVLLVMIAPGLALAGLSMAVESVTHTNLIHPAAAQIFGALPMYEDGQAIGTVDVRTEVRLGLMRARGAFAHAILAGVFLAAMLGLYLFGSLRKWPYLAGMAAGFCSIFSVSSAAFLALLVVLVLYAYDRLQQIVTFASWRLFMVVAGILMLVGQVVSSSGIAGIVIRLSLNPATGSYRLLIWEYGLESISRNPWFGIAFSGYDRPSWMIESIDNHWLLMGVRHGFIEPLLLLAAFITAIVAMSLAAVRQTSEADRRLCVGIAVVLAVIVITGFSVSFFGALASWIFVMLGIAVSIMNHERSKTLAATTVPHRIAFRTAS